METSFETSRLSLENLSSGDDGFILELVNTKGWLEFIGDRHVKSIEDATVYIQKIGNDQSITYWTVKLKENEIPIGVVTIFKRDYLDYPDIGFAFLPQFSGMGYAYEAAKSVLESVMNSAEYPCILATTIPGNENSIKLLKKLGLQFKTIIKPQDETLHLYSISK